MLARLSEFPSATGSWQGRIIKLECMYTSYLSFFLSTHPLLLLPVVFSMYSSETPLPRHLFLSSRFLSLSSRSSCLSYPDEKADVFC